jgi:hypothetical protein
MRDSYLEKKDQKGIGTGSYGYGRVRGVEGRGWRRQRFGGRNSVYFVTRDLVYKIYSPVATQTWDEPPFSLSLPHHIGSVPVTPDSDRSARTRGTRTGGQYLSNMAGAAIRALHAARCDPYTLNQGTQDAA